MKILFVEDELSKNISRVIRLFGKYLGKSRTARLEALDADPSGYGASSLEVKTIVDETGIVETDFHFPEALRKIVHFYDRYALFIIDRNLVESDYQYNEALEADSSFSEEKYNEYFEREGDYLLYKLALKGIDVGQKFFFLTAYDADSELKNAAGVEELTGHLGDFKKNNFIEKGNEKQFLRLKKIVENHQVINKVAENQHHVNLLRNYLDEDTSERFIKLLLDRDDGRRVGDNLNEIRQIYQKILSKCCAQIPGMSTACLDTYGNVVLGKQTLDWLSGNGYINSIIRNHCFSIKTICSDFGGHDNTAERQIFSPNEDTVNALFFALKDVIGWYGKISADRGKGRDNIHVKR